jgi:TRAP-type uncharacterized transport system fused permease subunit
MAAFIATLSAMAVSWFSPEHRMGPRRIIKALEVSGRRTVLIAAACAGAGLIVGVVTLTGIGLNISSLVISASGGNTIVALLLIMAASILMGMGTPTTVAYIIVATLGVPAMQSLGFAPLPSHFFVFYFGVISMVTPPVAVAAYAGAEIAGADMMRVGFIATRLCLVAFIIPFIFIFEPALLMAGSAPEILVAFVTAMIGIVSLAGALEGWYFRPIGWTFRLPLFVSAVLMIIPGLLTDLVGVTVFLGITAWCRFNKSSRTSALS